MYIYSDYAALSNFVHYKPYNNIQIYPLISFWFVIRVKLVNIRYVCHVVPSIWVSFLNV